MIRPLSLDEQCLLETEQALAQLHRESDGWYREWIIISPLATTETELVFEIDYAETWTNQVHSGGPFPVEPFQLRGPGIRLSKTELRELEAPGELLPKVKLPPQVGED